MVDAHTHTHARAHMHSRTHKHTPMLAHAHTHACTNAHTHARSCMHAHHRFIKSTITVCRGIIHTIITFDSIQNTLIWICELGFNVIECWDIVERHCIHIAGEKN